MSLDASEMVLKTDHDKVFSVESIFYSFYFIVCVFVGMLVCTTCLQI